MYLIRFSFMTRSPFGLGQLAGNNLPGDPTGQYHHIVNPRFLQRTTPVCVWQSRDAHPGTNCTISTTIDGEAY
jgi:hypothetical protein